MVPLGGSVATGPRSAGDHMPRLIAAMRCVPANETSGSVLPRRRAIVRKKRDTYQWTTARATTVAGRDSGEASAPSPSIAGARQLIHMTGDAVTRALGTPASAAAHVAANAASPA